MTILHSLALILLEIIVDEITEKMQAEGKDRHQIQDALMPFDLPMNYREKNERAGDK